MFKDLIDFTIPLITAIVLENIVVCVVVGLIMPIVEKTNHCGSPSASRPDWPCLEEFTTGFV
jgi:hypothetical protein